MFVRIFSIRFSLRSNREKKLLKALRISTRFVIVLSFAVKIFGISDGVSLTLNIDFMTFEVFLMLFN